MKSLITDIYEKANEMYARFYRKPQYLILSDKTLYDLATELAQAHYGVGMLIPTEFLGMAIIRLHHVKEEYIELGFDAKLY
jgi:hypothetical protein